MISYSAPIGLDKNFKGFKLGTLKQHPDGEGWVCVLQPNNKYLCITPDGDVEERDAPGSWERFRVSANSSSLIAERDGSVVYILSLVQ